MRHVLTLISNPQRPMLQNSIVEAAAVALSRCGAMVKAPHWLASDIACDLFFDCPDPAGAAAAVRGAIGRHPVDMVLQPQARRRKKIFFADLESTIIENEMLDEIAAQAGIADRIAPITARAMAGEIDFAQALGERVALLKGLRRRALVKARGAIRLSPGARPLVATLRAHGVYTVLVSGGFSLFCSHLRHRLGFDQELANEPQISFGLLTGRMMDPILDGDGKAAALRGIAANRGVALADTLAVGDGANDVAMIEAAGLGIAYRAKPVLRAAAPVCIDHGDLTAVLYVQGYQASEFHE